MQKEGKLYKSITDLTIATGLLLLIPLLAMQFNNEIVWTLFDFIIAGTLLFGTGFAYILATRVVDNIAYQIALGFSLFSVLFLIWVNLAVGIIGSADNPANLLYFGVIAVGIFGAIIAHLQPRRMAITMFAMSLAQMLVTGIALIAGMHKSIVSSVGEILVINGFFVALFIGSALLFRYAAQKHPSAKLKVEEQ